MSRTILHSHQYPNPADAHLEEVIAHRPGEHMPFVVWTHNKQTDGMCRGDYCADIVQAVDRFKERRDYIEECFPVPKEGP